MAVTPLKSTELCNPLYNLDQNFLPPKYMVCSSMDPEGSTLVTPPEFSGIPLKIPYFPSIISVIRYTPFS